MGRKGTKKMILYVTVSVVCLSVCLCVCLWWIKVSRLLGIGMMQTVGNLIVEMSVAERISGTVNNNE